MSASGIGYGGYMGKMLRVDLSRRRIREEPLEKGVVEKFIGGKGIGAWLLYRELKAGIDPLSPENKIIIATGPLTGTAALGYSAKYVIVTKSPLTNLFLDTYCGGFFGPRLKYAGYDAIIVEGRADKPVYLWIHDGEAEIKDASHIWGKNVHEAENMVKEEVGKEASVACIGPAGEKKVRFACVTTDFGRQAGRGGAGAVFGSKNLKAIATRGDKRVSIARTEEFESAVKEFREVIETSPTTGKDGGLRAHGTPAFVALANIVGGWPVRNWQRGFFERGDNIDDRAVDKLLVRPSACFGCPIACGRICEVKSGPYKGTRVEGPEYETIGALGANCEVGNIEAITYANMLCDQYGLDTISTGMVIGFAMDLYERGIISKKDTDGVDLRFGSEEALIAMIKKIGNREGFGDVLAEGAKRAAEKIGKNADYYAPVIRGLELPAWDPRAFWGYALTSAVCGGRDPHVYDFTLGRELAGIPEKLDRFTVEGKAKVVVFTEEHVAANDTLIHCLFYMFAPTFPIDSVKLLAPATGMDIDVEKFLKVGERVINVVRAFNVREGSTRQDFTLPSRLMKEPHTAGASKGRLVTKEMLDKMLDEYFDLRKWDKGTGIPTRGKLEELGLKEVADELSMGGGKGR